MSLEHTLQGWFYLDGAPVFAGNLVAGQCSATDPSGERCTRTVSLVHPFCPEHLQREMHLRVGASLIPGAGLGLFAETRFPTELAEQQLRLREFRPWAARIKRTGAPLLFRDGDVVAPLGGEVVDSLELRRRYHIDDIAYSYTSEMSKGVFEDAFLLREAGSYANTGLGPDGTSAIRHNNAVLQGIRDGRIKRAYIVATKPIYHGDEVLVYYGDTYTFNDPKKALFQLRKGPRLVPDRLYLRR